MHTFPHGRGVDGSFQNLHLSTWGLRVRDEGESPTTEGLIILAVILSVFLCLCLTLYFVLRYFRIRNAEPTYIPGSWLKGKWRSWVPSAAKRQYSSSLQDRRSLMSLQMTQTPMSASAQQSSRASRIDLHSSRDLSSRVEETGVDRSTSGRSVATLPAYSEALRPTEQLVGREGERAGMDNVVRYAESAEEIESRREEEMESLFQMRQARRDERALRRQIRRARAQGDEVTLDELRSRYIARSNSPSNLSNNLIEERQTQDRGRRASSVDYAGLGIARHDGSRVRGDSQGSQRALLDSAAPQGMAGAERSGSASGLPSSMRLRNASASSGHLLTTPDYSDDDRGSDFELVHTPRDSRNTSRSRLAMTSSNDEQQQVRVLEDDPPRYESSGVESVPPYEVATHHGQAMDLPPIEHLPAIEITPFSPIFDTSERD